MTKKSTINDLIISSTLKNRIILEKLCFIKISVEISNLDKISFYTFMGCKTSVRVKFIKAIPGVYKVAAADKAKFREPFISNKSLK